MGFLRFRRSIKLLPGVRLNFSKSGVSTSVGVRGAHVTLGHGQVRETVGLPGSGISYTEQHRLTEPTPASSSSSIGALVVLAIFVAIMFAAAYIVGVVIR